MVIVIGLNCLLAALMVWLARLVWRWRCALAQLQGQLQSQLQNPLQDQLQNQGPKTLLAPGQVGYALTRSRTQIAEMRLFVAQWQMRSRQAKQLLQLLQILRTVLFFRVRQRRTGRRLK
jgi:hypothetical protein